MKFITPQLILLCLIKFEYNLNRKIPYITDEELGMAGLLTREDIKKIGVKTKPDLCNHSYFEGDIALPNNVRLYNEKIYVELT